MKWKFDRFTHTHAQRVKRNKKRKKGKNVNSIWDNYRTERIEWFQLINSEFLWPLCCVCWDFDCFNDIPWSRNERPTTKERKEPAIFIPFGIAIKNSCHSKTNDSLGGSLFCLSFERYIQQWVIIFQIKKWILIIDRGT